MITGSTYPRIVVTISRPDFCAFGPMLMFPSLVSWKKSLYVDDSGPASCHADMNDDHSVEDFASSRALSCAIGESYTPSAYSILDSFTTLSILFSLRTKLSIS